MQGLDTSRQVTWPTFLVCLGYPLYFYLRRETTLRRIKEPSYSHDQSASLTSHHPFPKG